MAEDNKSVKPCDLVEINCQGHFYKCIVFVQEVRAWGIIGYIRSPGIGKAYTRVAWEQFKIIGKSHFTDSEDEEEDEEQAEQDEEEIIEY